jgi:predicted Zn finger-like uncharacterized protein
MDAELVNCPQCQRTLRVPNDLIGKQVKCPTCGHTFTGYPEATEAPPLPPAPEEKPVRTSVVPPDDFDEEEDRARRHRRNRRDEEDEEEEDRRRRRRARARRDDDEYDDYDERRPRRRRRDLEPHRGSAVLAIGILAFFMFPIILGPIAWIMGNTDLAEMRAGRMDPEGEGATNAGRICGMIATILGILVIVGVCVIFTALATAVGPASRGRY